MSAPDLALPISAASAESAPSGTEVLLEAARRQRTRVLSVAAALRLGGAATLLAISLVLWLVADDEDWASQIPTLIAYGTLALVTFMAQGRTIMVRMAWVQPLLDVGFAYAVLRTAILLGATNAQSIAGLSVAVLLLPVALAGLAFRTRTLVVVTLGAAAANVSLMIQADLGSWPILTATAILLLAASGSRLARQTIEAEITRRLLAETRARCEGLSRLQKEKDSLLNVIVHDMRTPANTILLSLEFLQEQMSHRVAVRTWTEAVADALGSSIDLSEMIAQILDTTRLEAGRMTLQLTVVDARDLMRKARDRAKGHAHSKSVTVELEAPNPLPVAVDPRLLQRALDSLLACSIRQAPTGGRVLLQATQEGSQARIAVHRTGPPIPADQRADLFEKFQPNDAAAQRLASWGLGLYFCRLTAQAHRADLAVENVEGWSASYVLRLSLLPSSLGVASGESADSLHSTPLPAASPAASALLSVRRTPASPRKKSALAKFARALTPIEGVLVKTGQGGA